MQKYQLVFLAVFYAATLSAQEFYESFRFTEVLDCPFNTALQVEWPEGWSVYHTKDNQWDGDIDSAWCISVELVIQGGFTRWMYLNAEEIDGERPVFVRTSNHPALPLHLPPNMLYSITGVVQMEDFNTLIIGNSNPPLSGILFSIDIPAEDFIQRDERNNFYEFQDSVFTAIENCAASEKFEDQYLKEVVMSLSIRHSQTKGHLLVLDGIYLSSLYWFDIVSEHTIDQQWWVDTSYIVPLGALGTTSYYYENYMLPYTSPAYPAPDHISYFDLAPEKQSDTAQTITVVVDDYMTLTPQPFTAFRGGLVSTLDTIRHHVELMNNGGNLCINIVELVFEENTKYLHMAGTIDMQSDLSCMMFKSNATFEVGRGAHLDYGDNGMGFMAMKQGSNMILRENASLTINNTLVLQLSPTSNHTHPTVTLYPGSTLSFSSHGMLDAWGSPELRLRVMMLGGTINVDELSARECALIEFIYPTASPSTPANDLIIVQDNSDDDLRLYFMAEKEESGRVFITDLMGHVVYESKCDISPGFYYFPVDLGNIPEGWYGATVQTADRQLSAAFIHQLRE